MPARSSTSYILLLVCVAITFLSCGTSRENITFPVDTGQVFSDSGNAAIPEKWWTTFKDPVLNSLIDTALQSNFDLKTAWQRLRAAQAILDREASSLYPELDAFAEGEVRKNEFEEGENLSLGLTSQYEIDLWGRINSQVDTEEYRARAAYTDYQTAALSLSAEIVRTWYMLTEAWNQLKLVESQIETNEKMFRLIKARFGSGQIRSVDILRQEQLLESTREQKIAVESRIEVLEHQIAVLLGRPPQEGIQYIPKQLPELPPVPKTGLPSELVQRRPDVKSAYNLLKAADNQLAAAISSQYPRLTLTASMSTSAEKVDNLFNDWFGSVAGNLLAPIFRGGELSAEVDRAEAVRQQRLYEYSQIVLSAFREVEDALIREKKQVERISSLERQMELITQSYEQLRLEYFNGISDYLDVLTALTDEQQLQRDYISAQMTLLEYRIALYRSLAGGFKTEREKVE